MLGLALLSIVACAQAQAPAAPDPWTAVAFLEGTWDAKATGANGAAVDGRYTFVRELGNHVLARHGSTADCKAPTAYDCEHGDLLYVFQEGPGQTLKALYLDNEGHVIHYVVSSPNPDQAMFLSEPGPGPRFRLLYALNNGVMIGKFQIQSPGQSGWTSYLEWRGAKAVPSIRP